MRFLIDAQLPLKLTQWLRQHGHDSRHTLELPAGNRTTDAEIVACAVTEGRIVVTKDSDFVQTFLLTDQPRLLLISTGNIGNAELESLLRNNLSTIERAFGSANFVELTRVALIAHQ